MKTKFKVYFAIMFLALVALCGVILVMKPAYAAGPWYVAPSGDDGNTCTSPGEACATINGAIGKASSGDTIYVAIGTYTGGGYEVVLIDKNITLSGGWDESFATQEGTSIIDGEEARRGITVNGGVTTFIERFTVQNGFVERGGGIYNDGGTVTLKNSTVSGNVVIGYDGYGGGIFNDGTMTLNNSTVHDNSSNWEGGGIFNGGPMTLNDSSVSGNMITGESMGSGGGIWNGNVLKINNSTISGNSAGYGGGIYSWQLTTTINSSTVSGNTATEGGGGIEIFGGSVRLKNSILAENTHDSSPDCGGSIETSGYNIIGDTKGCGINPGTGDLINVNARLGSLVGALNYPKYHPLMANSPAIDAGNPSGCTNNKGDPLLTDQRGAPRVGICDIGAYEYTIPGSPDSISANGGEQQYAGPFAAFPELLESVVLDNIGSPMGTGLTVTFIAPQSGASGVFLDTGTFTTTAATDESGIATAATFIANGQMGSYTVTATVGGVPTLANFMLTNFGWFVSPRGDNANDCQTSTTSCATINGVLGKSGFNPGDTVLVAIGTYTSTGDEVVLLDKSVRLLGGWNEAFTAQVGKSIIDGSNKRWGIHVYGGVTAIVESFTIQKGSQRGIFNGGTLTLNNCTVSDNITVGSVGGGGINNGWILIINNSIISKNISASDGGGISNGGYATLNNSTVSGNTLTSNSGGGISNERDATLILNNSTVSGNTVTTGGGGGINNGGVLILNNSTISGNTHSGIDTDRYGNVIMQNTVLAGNSTSGNGPDCYGEINSSGYNLLGNTSECNFIATTGDIVDVDAGLLSLTGTPGYHALLPCSPTVDAGNPAGCTDDQGNPLDTDQRGIARPLDGNGDGTATCDIGAYEYDPNNDPQSCVFLPHTTNNYCSDYFDDFSDPASGWYVGEDDIARSEYLNGEFRVLSKQVGYNNLYWAPTCDRQNYVVEVDARWEGTPGSSYGLLFGLTGDFDQYYLFDVNTDNQEYRLMRFDGTDYQQIVPVTSTLSINAGTAINHLRVTRDGDQIALEANGTELGTWTDGNITGLTGAGIVASPYDDNPTSDARFDNFSVIRLPDNVATSSGLSEMNPLSNHKTNHAKLPKDEDR
jgi:hypothetical protein